MSANITQHTKEGKEVSTVFRKGSQRHPKDVRACRQLCLALKCHVGFDILGLGKRWWSFEDMSTLCLIPVQI